MLWIIKLVACQILWAKCRFVFGQIQYFIDKCHWNNSIGFYLQIRRRVVLYLRKKRSIGIFRFLMYFLHHRYSHETNAAYDKRSIDSTAVGCYWLALADRWIRVVSSNRCDLMMRTALRQDLRIINRGISESRTCIAILIDAPAYEPPVWLVIIESILASVPFFAGASSMRILETSDNKKKFGQLCL